MEKINWRDFANASPSIPVLTDAEIQLMDRFKQMLIEEGVDPNYELTLQSVMSEVYKSRTECTYDDYETLITQLKEEVQEWEIETAYREETQEETQEDDKIENDSEDVDFSEYEVKHSDDGGEVFDYEAEVMRSFEHGDPELYGL